MGCGKVLRWLRTGCRIGYMASDKTPLVLLHGILMSGNCWQDVVPLLSDRHQVHTPTTAGHHGGPALLRSPATVGDLVDELERYLDERRLERPHLAGSRSAGGWPSSCPAWPRSNRMCVGPGGFWSAEMAHRPKCRSRSDQYAAIGRLARPVRPAVAVAMKSATVRRLGFRDAACHADRITAAQSIETVDDIIGCTLNVDDVSTLDEQSRRWIPCHVQSPSRGRVTMR